VRGIGLAFAGVFTAAVVVASGSAAPTGTANISVNIAAGTSVRAPILQRGDTATIASLKFKAGMTLDSFGPDLASVSARFELPAGLHWGDDLPDPGENCTGTANVADCHPPFQLDWTNPQMAGFGWIWDVVADAPGTYVLNAQLLTSSAADPEAANNSSSVTVVVKEPAAVVRAGTVKVLPANPKAGAVVSARVAVTGATPTKVACTGTVGGAKLSGAGRATAGAATCRYRTPRAAKGKTLRGSVAFSANGTKIAKRFAVRLR
jgi:hypothetical protein